MKPVTLTSALALALAVLAAGCDGGGTAGETSEPPVQTGGQPAGSGVVLVDVRTGVGAFTPVELVIENRPEFRLYGDGTVVVRGPEQGLLPRPWTYRLSQAGIDAVLAAAAQANLFSDPPDYGLPPVMDVGSTTVSLNVGGETIVRSAYALGFEDPAGDALTPAQREARTALAGFVAFVTVLARARPDLLVTRPAPFEPEAVDLYVWPAPEETTGAAALEWPLGTPPEALPAVGGVIESRCETVRGADLEALEQALADTEAPVTWRSGGRLWSSGFHVVLPGEEGCQA